MNRAWERHRATELKAPDARKLIKAALPYVLERMTAAQVDQVQRVIDSYFVNPVLEKEWKELDRKSIIAQSGGYANRDPVIVARREKVFENTIRIQESDKRIRLDFHKLLATDAMKPLTDNMDEVMFWKMTLTTLKDAGVWLRFDRELVRDPVDHQFTLDNRSFKLWLSLGAGGDAFPTRTGLLDRAALLGNTRLGAGYYTKVFNGNIETVLKKAIARVENQIDDGSTLHRMVAIERSRAAPGVVPISDALGRASFPDEKIWDLPHRELLQAMNLNVGGNVRKSSLVVVIAAVDAEIAGKKLAAYMAATGKGAQRAVKALTVVKTVGEVAEVSLAVYFVATGMVRILARGAAAEVGAGAGASARRGAVAGPGAPPVTMRPGVAYQTNYPGPEALAETLNTANVTMDGTLGGAVNRYSVADARRNVEMLADFERSLAAGPTWSGRLDDMSAIEAKVRILEDLASRWGTPP